MEPEYPVKTHGFSIGQIKNFLGLAQTFKQLFIYVYRQLNNQFCDFQKNILNCINSYKTEDDWEGRSSKPNYIFLIHFDKQVLKCILCQHRKGTNYLNTTILKIFKIILKYFGFLKNHLNLLRQTQ